MFVRLFHRFPILLGIGSIKHQQIFSKIYILRMGSIVDKLILFICVMCTDILCVCVSTDHRGLPVFLWKLIGWHTNPRIHSIHPGHLCHLWGLDFKANKWRHKAKGLFFFLANNNKPFVLLTCESCDLC